MSDANRIGGSQGRRGARVAAKYILGSLAVVFLIAGARRATSAGLTHPQSRAWLLIGVMFGLVSGWLFLAN